MRIQTIALRTLVGCLAFSGIIGLAQASGAYTFRTAVPGLRAQAVQAAAPPSTLYPFTTFTFSTCGATGSSGPTLATCLAQSAYSSSGWATNSSYFADTAGIQSWVVPQTGTYQITAAGAAGGNAGSTGLGAVVSATVTLTQGEVIEILVGQQGGVSSSSGGGGGTFVVAPGNTPLVIAGGGAGFLGASGQNAANASVLTLGKNSSDGTGAGGTGGQGGTGSSNGWGAAGGGFSTAGTKGSVTSPASGGGGQSFLQGGAGGTSPTTAVGGFGGGGGTHGNTGGGGGGGGYSGGGGSGQSVSGASGGGGGSYYTGTLVSTGVTNLGAGYATITLK